MSAPRREAPSPGETEAQRPPERWTELRVVCPLGWQELVAEVLAEFGAASAVFGRTSIGLPEPPEGCELVRAFWPERDDAPERRAALEARLAALAEATGAPELAGLAVEFRPLPPEDWARSWKKSWKPFRVGRLVVAPPWKAPALRPDDVHLVFHPRSAFGTGRHATTRTCLALLQELVRGGERVLDAGSGSGILSVAALLLGARSALGIDIDPNAAPNARDLARENGVLDRCEFREGGFEALHPDERGFDLVCANIYADVIAAHAADLASRLAPSGRLLASGIPAAKSDLAERALRAAGLAPLAERVRGRWHTLLYARAE